MAPGLSLEEAFSWPKRLMEKLPGLLEEVHAFGIPIASEAWTLRVVSSFSGICSQSRAARALQSQSTFKIRFEEVQTLAGLLYGGGVALQSVFQPTMRQQESYVIH